MEGDGERATKRPRLDPAPTPAPSIPTPTPQNMPTSYDLLFNSPGRGEEGPGDHLVSPCDLNLPYRIGAAFAFAFDKPEYSDYRLELSDVQGVRLLPVTKLVVAAHSPVLRALPALHPDQAPVHLPDGTLIPDMLDLVRYMYEGAFQSPPERLPAVARLAAHFRSVAPLRALVESLCASLTVPQAANLIELATELRALVPGTGAEEAAVVESAKLLEDKARAHLLLRLGDLDEAMTTPDFLALTPRALEVLLASPDLALGTENTAFAALRQWLHAAWDLRRPHAAPLLRTIRFPYLMRNYLLDVVRTEADLDYPDEAKKVFAKRIIDAYLWHTSSAPRREVLGDPLPEPRLYDERRLASKFAWRVDQVSGKKEEWSPPFALGGYFFSLLFHRKNTSEQGGGTLGLYMHIKVRESGLGTKFYVPLVFELLVFNKVTRKYTSIKGVYSSPFTYANRAWGYVDMLGMRWLDFLAPTCPWRTEQDELSVMVQVTFPPSEFPSLKASAPVQ